MNKSAAFTCALGAVFIAALTPVGVIGLRRFGAPDLAQGFIIGAGFGAALLLCALALRLRTA